MIERSSLFVLLSLSITLLLLLGCPVRTDAAPGDDLPVPDGFDHEPVIMTKEKLASLKAAKVASGAPATASQPEAAVLESVPLSPTVPADGRFAPRHSFSGPWPDKKLIPYWEIGAGASVEEKFLRLTPPKQSRTGFGWNNQMVEMTDWEVTLEFSVAGRKDIGGDGFALWFVERPEILGMVYGSTDYWNGLGIFFDTFNNDGVGQNPLISAVFNDGTQKFDASSDGATQALESCSFDFRNQPVTSMAKLKFQGHALSLDISVKRDAAGQPIWQKCFALEGIELGVDKYFGVTAHTGDVADSHDIYRFEVRDLSPAVVDLDSVRNKYAEEMQHQHLDHEHGHALSIEEFQHSVLTLLSQIQGEVNMLETGQIEMQEYLNALREDRFAREQEALHAGASAAAAATIAAQQEQAALGGAKGAPAAGGAALDPVSVNRIANTAEQTATILSEVKLLKTSVTTLPALVTNMLKTASGAGAAAGTGAIPTAGGEVSLTPSASQSLLTSFKEALPPILTVSMESLSREQNAKQQQLHSLYATSQTKVEDLSNEVKKLQGQLAQVLTLLNNLPTQGSGSGSTNSQAVAANSDSSFLILGVVLFSALLTLILTCHSCQQSRQKDRWKLT